jgi:glycosyltransferase involved in cell wall biosynthesis
MENNYRPSMVTVITAYNRRHCVARAIDSVFMSLPGRGVIVVDDASRDGTARYIQNHYKSAIADGSLRLIELKENIGVSGAKNYGYEAASEDWVIFLDSDDSYMPQVGAAIDAALCANAGSPIIFFRCQDQTGAFVGEQQGVELELDLATYLKHTSFGEALTVINKNLVGPSPPYITSLRGYEGLGCARIINKYGSAHLSAITARIYDTSAVDRLSISVGLLQRLRFIGRGHWMLVREFRGSMPLLMSLSFLIKAASYFLLGSLYCLVGPCQ